MRVAISSENNNGLDSPVSHHFGHCPYFTLVDMDGEEIKGVKAIANPFFEHHQPGMVPGFVKEQTANVMLAGGMGRRAIDFFNQFGIQVATGANGTVRTALNSYLKGELQGASPCKDHENGHGNHDC